MGWTVIKRLGEGGHGFVSLARSSPSPDDDHIVTAMNLPPLIAVKSAPFSYYEPLQFERETLYSLQGCPEIIRCYGADACFDEQGGILYNVFLEYAAGGSLVDRIYSGEPLGEEEIKEYTRSILRGLRYIHSKGMVHCDIKPDNILLVVDDTTGAHVAKVADLGLAICYDPTNIENYRSNFARKILRFQSLDEKEIEENILRREKNTLI